MEEANKLTRRTVIRTGAGLLGGLVALKSGTLQAWAQPGFVTPDGADAGGAQLNAAADDAQWKGVEAALGGTKGKLKDGGVFQVVVPRSDLNVTITGVPVKSDAGIANEFTFLRKGNTGYTKYEFALLEREVNPVLTALLAQNLMPATEVFAAVHNHYLEVSPVVVFMHGFIEGTVEHTANVLHSVLSSNTGTPFGHGDEPPGRPGFDTNSVKHTVGGEGDLSNGVLEVSVPRSETIRETGVMLPASMQFESTAYFQSLGGEQAIMLGEFVVLASEADAVVRQLQQYDITITALHSHELDVQPNFYYLHCSAKGPVYRLARGVRAGLNKTKSAFK